MAAEVVVVVEQQDLLICAEQLLIEAGGGQAADPGADDHQIVLPFKGNIGKIILLAVTGDAVGRFERARVVTAQAGEGGRVGQGFIRQRAAAFGSLEQIDGGDACRNGNGNAVEKISACNTHGNTCCMKNGKAQSGMGS